ncbi:hypothetical protein D9756_008349 [Leucocoprinus leucothites]|uniref:Uncharacterized protein n=1 Tax=Leucocoprinus leucothites TaxID=201217 RepID=A0A8H5D1U3_9AGAR|nr:hypothetical protein D9756_008349 [Leucoagaricus leucothites]
MMLKKMQIQTPTTDASSPISMPLFLLRNIQSSLTTCTPVNITWAYAGPAIPSLNLFATNIGVVPPTSETSPTNTFTDGDAFAVPSGASQLQPTQVTIVQNLVPQASAVAWNVNVPSGWYQIFGNIQSTFQDRTDPFFIQAGDTSCLAGALTTSRSGKSISSDTVLTTSESTTSQSLTPASSSHNSRVPMIAGLSAGMVTFIVTIALLCWWWRRRSRNQMIVVSVQTRSAYGVLDESPEHSIRQPRRVMLSRVLNISAPANRGYQNHGLVSDLDSMSGGNSGSAESEVDPLRLSNSTITQSTLPSYRSHGTEPPQYQSFTASGGSL